MFSALKAGAEKKRTWYHFPASPYIIFLRAGKFTVTCLCKRGSSVWKGPPLLVGTDHTQMNDHENEGDECGN